MTLATIIHAPYLERASNPTKKNQTTKLPFKCIKIQLPNIFNNFITRLTTSPNKATAAAKQSCPSNGQTSMVAAATSRAIRTS